jgi:RNA polymerase sigma-70 factor (ECF subfamily)
LEHQTDSELMKLVQAGDAAQLAHLFERHHVALFRYLYQLTYNAALSEDLTQEVFLRVLKYAAAYNPSLGFRGWIYGMARNACHDARHKVRGETGDNDVTEFRSSDPSPEDQLMQHRNTRMLQEALKRLPDDKREVLELSRFQDMRYEEIATVLGCEVGTVKVRVYRALKELREKFFELRGRQIA